MPQQVCLSGQLGFVPLAADHSDKQTDTEKSQAGTAMSAYEPPQRLPSVREVCTFDQQFRRIIALGSNVI